MFILYALVVGVLVGFLVGGRLSGLARLEFRWAPLILAGLAVQLLLFADPVAERIGQFGPPIYVASTLAVLAGVVRNVHVAGMPLVVAGAASNVVAIAANGGFMPVSEAALRANGRTPATIYSNSRLIEDPALAPLTDIFAMPAVDALRERLLGRRSADRGGHRVRDRERDAGRSPRSRGRCRRATPPFSVGRPVPLGDVLRCVPSVVS